LNRDGCLGIMAGECLIISLKVFLFVPEDYPRRLIFNYVVSNMEPGAGCFTKSVCVGTETSAFCKRLREFGEEN
jgi:hypothetical protein